MSCSSSNHTGLISRFNAWLMHHGSDRYNRLTHERKQRLFCGLSGRVLAVVGPHIMGKALKK